MHGKFEVTFAYFCDGGATVGSAPVRRLAGKDLEFALAMIDPFRHEEWMRSLSRLRRRGESATIAMTSESDSRGTVGRVVKVVRV